MSEIFLFSILLLSLVSIVITSGVVLRVEKRLDTSYKFFLFAIIVFTLGIFADILEFYGFLPPWKWEAIIKAVFIILFTLGVYEMRTLIVNITKKNKK